MFKASLLAYVVMYGALYSTVEGFAGCTDVELVIEVVVAGINVVGYYRLLGIRRERRQADQEEKGKSHTPLRSGACFSIELPISTKYDHSAKSSLTYENNRSETTSK